ncbi:LCP family protein [Streptomyces fulvorobeus]|uniref:LCP family protein required for cell wall assembly n=1 Tax=Streptomyces fulvorobeus TaxID=284028 RepID=A0A7J0C8G7_9ACTN|nr:LCP family protein [Streptomyces fulvorobeus]NYE42272.1 LCP family protein required for cell wall assembly [Streptomyces fulvorobeus]GFM98658.1 LytR family transcriptional regulator [Streptomyces fulvorobeus]
MDAQGRGRGEAVDPADQWVLNPDTGDYELRLTPTAEQPPAPAAPGRSARRRPAEGERATVPGQRGRRPDPQASRQSRGRSSRQTAEQPPGRRRPKPKARKKKALAWTGGVTAFLLVAVGAGGYLLYQHFNGNLTAVADDGAGTGGFSQDRAINVLVIGTDKRTGAGNEGYGDAGSVGHADTTILLHVSKDRTNATALSIPRDLITDIPVCPTTQSDGTVKDIPGTPGTRFNESLGQFDRTPSCTMRTITELTGVKVDHFMVADFNAVKTLTTAVDGVDVCLAKDIDDDKSHLKLSQGEHTLDGEQALAFLRTRKSVGFGGDLSRIEIQQQFLGSLMRKLKSNETLTSPTKMWKLAEAATKALTVDERIDDINQLRKLGMELSSVDVKNITFTTVPVVDNPAETVKATVVLDRARAPQLFSMIREDISLTDVKKQKKAQAEAKLKGPRAASADVRVDVYNGGAPAGSAQEAIDWLQNAQGVLQSSNRANAPEKVAKTQLVYGPDQADQARRLADLMGLSVSALKPTTTDSGGTEPMRLTLGPDFTAAGTPLTPPSKTPEGIQRVEADKPVCAK